MTKSVDCVNPIVEILQRTFFRSIMLLVVQEVAASVQRVVVVYVLLQCKKTNSSRCVKEHPSVALFSFRTPFIPIRLLENVGNSSVKSVKRYSK
jgi:hypothetical protein